MSSGRRHQILTNPRKPDVSPSSTQGLGVMIDMLDFNMAQWRVAALQKTTQ